MPFVYIKKVKNHQYVEVCESYRDPKTMRPRRRTLERHGNLKTLLEKDPEYVAKLEARCADLRDAEQEARAKQYAVNMEKAIEELRGRQNAAAKPNGARVLNVGAALVYEVWKNLEMPALFRRLQSDTEIEYPYDKLAFLLCCQRLIHPASKLQTFNSRDKLIMSLPGLNDLNTIYRTLDQLDKDKDKILKRLNTAISKKIERDLTVAFYDVTTYYFESRQESEMRGFGMSKDGKPGEVQVVLGLVIDDKGIPIDYELYRGNESEFGTMAPIIERVISRYNIRKLTVVADRGLNSSQNLLKLSEKGIDFVIAQKVRNCSAEKQEEILSDENWRTTLATDEGEILCRYKTLDVMREVRESRISEKTGRKYITNNVLATLPVKWVVTYSQSRANKDLSDLNRAIDKAQKALDEHQPLKSNRGYRALIKAPKLKGDSEHKPSLNEEKIADARKWAGYYAICTNRTDIDEKEIVRIYRQLWRIEDCFRTSKTNLESRPCFVWNDARIRGHFLSCYVALTIQKYMEHLLKLELGDDRVTTNKMCSALQNANVAVIRGHGCNPATCYLRLYEAGLFDDMSRCFGLEPLLELEEAVGIRRKLKLRQINQGASDIVTT